MRPSTQLPGQIRAQFGPKKRNGNPRAAPQRVSARAAAFASLSTLTGIRYFAAIFSASGKFRQQGRFGGLRTTPVFGSRGPGAQIPMLWNPPSDAEDDKESMAPVTASKAAWAV